MLVGYDRQPISSCPNLHEIQGLGVVLPEINIGRLVKEAKLQTKKERLLKSKS